MLVLAAIVVAVAVIEPEARASEQAEPGTAPAREPESARAEAAFYEAA